MSVNPADKKKIDKETLKTMEDPLKLFKDNPDFNPPPSPKPEELEEESSQRGPPLIKLSSPITDAEYMYVMNKYDYDPNDDVVNKFTETEAENFIRQLVVEYRVKHGLKV